MGAYYIFSLYGFKSIAIFWIGFASIVFYGWDDPSRLIPILLFSIIFNYIIGKKLSSNGKKYILVLGVSLNLFYLFVFKYFNFVAAELAAIGLPKTEFNITLPIGISFYTFTQIAYLVDVYRQHVPAYSLNRYTFFVTNFPHLIAGPIIHHAKIMPQLNLGTLCRFNAHNISLGLAWFSMGLFKKVVMADSLAIAANIIFALPKVSSKINFSDAWLGALSYSLQIYFDFSGYSDMAIGLALMMGIVFPVNFLSPYKACSLIDFWRRWNITLSHFLRDYLYFSLGGSRHGSLRRYINLIITMALGGLWHGASYNFLLWGFMHGIGLAISHFIHQLTSAKLFFKNNVFVFSCYLITQIFVIFAWVPFRADNLPLTIDVWSAMFNFNGSNSIGFAEKPSAWIIVIFAGVVAISMPNTAQIFGRYSDYIGINFKWKPSLFWAIFSAFLFGIAAGLSFTQTSAFLYFQF